MHNSKKKRKQSGKIQDHKEAEMDKKFSDLKL